MKRLFLSLIAVLVIGLLLFGCTQSGANPSAIPGTSSGQSGQNSGFVSASPAPSSGSVNSASPSPSPSSGAYDTSGMDQVGPDVDNLDALSKDLSAGDVSPPLDEAG